MRQTYLILIRDGKLALAVGAALEERLEADGHQAVALVPAVRGADVAGPDARAGAGKRPVAVALHEDGLLERLEDLGMAAYVGMRPGKDWRLVRWGIHAGAMLLPVASARDLVGAIADHTPWHDSALWRSHAGAGGESGSGDAGPGSGDGSAGSGDDRGAAGPGPASLPGQPGPGGYSRPVALRLR